MREIKFRAWAKNDKEMLDDIYLGDFDDGYVLGAEGEKDRYIKDFEWMQYTGLKDKNGKEIYEADILKQNIRNEFGSLIKGRIGQMVWHEDGMWAIKFEYESPINFEGNCPPPEIIGNIYENPDLLK